MLAGTPAHVKRRSLQKVRTFPNKPGDDLLSHTVSRAVPSALKGLTAVFGKGPGGAPSLWSPDLFLLFLGQWHKTELQE